MSIPYLLWMTFFAENNLINTIKLRRKYIEIVREKKYYESKNEEVQKDLRELKTNKSLLERYAREKYHMKKPSEDVYIIER